MNDVQLKYGFFLCSNRLFEVPKMRALGGASLTKRIALSHRGKRECLYCHHSEKFVGRRLLLALVGASISSVVQGQLSAIQRRKNNAFRIIDIAPRS